jgi:hypothetical protein
MASGSGRDMAQALDITRVYADRNFRPRSTDFIINWGNAEHPNWSVDTPAVFLNHPDAVKKANDKLSAFCAFDSAGIPTVDWTRNHEVAKKWYESGEVVMARSLSRASGGRGITVCNPLGTAVNPKTELVEAPFYTRFQTHICEYRVHIFNEEVLSTTRKRRLHGANLIDRGLEPRQEGERIFIRNHANGYIYSEDLGWDESSVTAVEELARQAVKTLGLDFGAVDVINSKKYGTFILEVNTAPGVEGRTIEAYKEAFTRSINNAK